ncbi:MAG: DMT family transporter [Myxococcota bacterium]
MPAASADRRTGLAWAFAAALGSAGFVIPWKLANEAGDPAHSVLLLLGGAALANSLLVLGQRLAAGSLRASGLRADLGVAALLAAFTLFGNVASARAIAVLSPALLNVLLRAEVLLVAVFAWAMLGERVDRRFWLGAGIALVGLLVIQGHPAEIATRAFLTSGAGLAIGAAACFSMLAVVTRRFIHAIDPVVVNALRLWMAVALWFPFYEAPRLDALPREQVLYAGLAAVLGPFASRLCLMLSARHLAARVTTLASLTAPAITLGLAWLLLSDWPKPNELIGGAILVAGIAIPLLGRRRRPDTPIPGDELRSAAGDQSMR